MSTTTLLSLANGTYLAALAIGVVASVAIVLLSNAANRAAAVEIARANETAELARRKSAELAVELEKERSARLALEAKLGDLDADYVAQFESGLK